MATYKIGADVGNFKQGVSEAQASLRTLDAALKVNEASFKAGGDAQIYMQQKTQLLNDKMTRQRQLVEQLQQGLRQMREQGVKPTSEEYQKLETKMLNAQSAMLETKSSIDGLDSSQQKAAGSAAELTTAVNNIGKKISLDQVIGGINSITTTMEKAAGKAVQLGETIWNNVMNSAKWADDAATMALMYDIPLEKYLQMQQLVQNGMDTSVEAILKSQTKLNKNIGDGNKSTLEAMRDLGVTLSYVTGEAMDIVHRKDPADVFWELGDALMHAEKGFDRESAAQAIFGRSWKELVPLFTEFKNQGEFDEALSKVHTNTEKEVNNLATLNDRVSELQGNITTLTNKGWAALAPSLTGAAEALNGLMGSVLDYLDTPQGKEALETLGSSVSTLFEDLGKIDPESVVENFTNVFNTLVNGFKWIKNNKDGVITALKGIVIGWGALKLTGGALEIAKLVSGITGLASAGTATAAASGGAAAGAAWAGAFLMKVVPVSAFLATLFHNAFTHQGNDDLIDENGNLTELAKENGMTLDSNGEIVVNGNQGKSTLTLDEIIAAGEQRKARQSNPLVIDLTWGRNVGGAETQKTRKLMDLSENWAAYVKRWNDYFSVNDAPAETGSSMGSPNSPLNIVKKLADGGLRTGSGGVSIPGIMDLSGVWGDFVQRWNDYFSTNNNLTAVTEPELAEDAVEQLQQEMDSTFGSGAASKVTFIARPKPSEDAADKLSEEIGIVPVTVQPIISAGAMGGASTGAGWAMLMQAAEWGGMIGLGKHANGLSFVPFDNYPALLHRGERVQTAREVESRSYNSNLYVEKMIMNNGADAQGLAAAMAAAQRRRMSGYGS